MQMVIHEGWEMGLGKYGSKEKWLPLIGTVCMDMIMIDVTDIPDVQEGDEVIIFGKPITGAATGRMGGNDTLRDNDRNFTEGKKGLFRENKEVK